MKISVRMIKQSGMYAHEKFCSHLSFSRIVTFITSFLQCKQLVNQNALWLTESFPHIQNTARDSLDREINRLLTGLDKLYTTSPTLTRDQVRESSEITDNKIHEKLESVRKSVETRRQGLYDEGKPVVREGMDALRKIMDNEGEDLKMKVSLGFVRD